MKSFQSLQSAYEGVEGAVPREALAAYRAAALARSAEQVSFISSLMKGSVVEVGCGNGRLLIALKQAGAIEAGLGVDFAESRVAFAAAWASDLGLTGLQFTAGDALGCELGSGHGAALCITGAFGYFDAYVPGTAQRLLSRLRGSLADSGQLVLELYQHASDVRLLNAQEGSLCRWAELEESDPWRFFLSELSLDGNVLTHKKIFVHRTDGQIDEGRAERLALYSPDDIEAMCSTAGFHEIHFFDGWSAEPYDGGETMVVVATAC